MEELNHLTRERREEVQEGTAIYKHTCRRISLSNLAELSYHFILHSRILYSAQIVHTSQKCLHFLCAASPPTGEGSNTDIWTSKISAFECILSKKLGDVGSTFTKICNLKVLLIIWMLPHILGSKMAVLVSIRNGEQLKSWW